MMRLSEGQIWERHEREPINEVRPCRYLHSSVPYQSLSESIVQAWPCLFDTHLLVAVRLVDKEAGCETNASERTSETIR